MNLGVRGIDHQPLEIRLGDQGLEQPGPHALITPATEVPMGVFPALPAKESEAKAGRRGCGIWPA